MGRKALLRIRAVLRRAGFSPRRVQGTLILLALGTLYALETRTLGVFVPCPFHRLTGLKCPGCGITTAILALLGGEVQAAFAANPGLAFSLPVLGPYLCWLFWHWLREQTVQSRAADRLGAGLLVYFALWGLVRNLPALAGFLRGLW